jgi:hypothetical protein
VPPRCNGGATTKHNEIIAEFSTACEVRSLPQNGVRIFMMSVKVGDLGSAIFGEATGPGAKDQGCQSGVHPA